jgi:hemolysin activation/secretion protein
MIPRTLYIWRISPTLGVMALAMSLCFTSSIFAQSQADREAASRQAEIIQRQEQERQRSEQEDRRRRAERVDGADTNQMLPKINVPSMGAVCRPIGQLVIKSAPRLTGKVRAQLAADFTNRCLNVSDIERILSLITKFYIDHGYIAARAYLSAQDLSQGKLEIVVIEGVVEKIKIQDGKPPEFSSISIKNVFPFVEGEILNLRDLEQGIDQINRLTSNNAQMEILPGARPGDSIVLIKNQPSSLLHGSVSTDGQGSVSTGRIQSGVSFTADNLIGVNDMWSWTHRHSTPYDPGRTYSRSNTLTMSIPFGYTTWSIMNNSSEYASVITPPSGVQAVANGTNKISNMRLDRTVFRDQSTRFLLASTITTKEGKNYYNDQFLSVSSRNLTVLDLDSTLSTPVLGGSLALDVGYALGLKQMAALRDPDNLPDWAAKAQFGKFKLGFNWTRDFSVGGQGFRFNSAAVAQKARDVLYGSEQIAIGGLYSVRGFVNTVLTGDHGYYWRNELSVQRPINLWGETFSTRFYVGVDMGEVKNRAPNVVEGRLVGAALGMSTKFQGWTWDLFHTRPLSWPDSKEKEGGQLWFRLAYGF